MAGSGVLILVAGPSGSGKDTLIAAARRAFAGDDRFAFPTRFITREDQTGEEHIHVSAKDFERLRREDLFFLDWDAHGHSYGIPASVRNDLIEGRAVVCNVSRKLIPAARAAWKATEVILVSVSPETLKERLRRRGRESETEIENRVKRASDKACLPVGPLHCLDNSGALEVSIQAFFELLLRLVDGHSAKRMTAYDLESAAAARFT